MNILFHLGHPAHFHLFKNTIYELKENDHEIHILIKTKDILEDLLIAANIPYTNILPKGRKDGILGIIFGLIKKNIAIYKYCKKHKPDIMAGTSAEIAHIGKILKIPSINFIEDDYNIVRKFGISTYPFTDVILSPVSCDNGIWNKKTIAYNGFHKLAYLHPKRFRPDIKIVRKYVDTSKPYFILRFAKLNAHHDDGALGINNQIAEGLVKRLTEHGSVLITSERTISDSLEPYRMKINPLDIHHLMSYSDLFVGDSQSMSVEAAMLGVPSIRFSSFSGQIGVLEELSNKYKLAYGIQPTETEHLYNRIDQIITCQESKKIFAERRDKMLSEKIDVASFFTWFISNYPNSYETMKNNSSYELNFK